jgi:Protein of unknown function (DUF2637)
VNRSDRAIRVLTTLAVLVVAAIAAVISFVHIEHLAVTHGQTMLAAMLLPLSIDGTVAASSLVMLRAARMTLPTPKLARAMLGLSVLATLACNVLYGAGFGIVGALLSGWPAIAFIGTAEMAIGMIRRARTAPVAVADVAGAGVYPAPDDTAQTVADVPVVPVPTDNQSAALIALRATLAAGNPLSGRQLETRFGLTRAAATSVRQVVLVESNGHLAESSGQEAS